MWKEKKESYVLEYCYQNGFVSIPFKFSKSLTLKIVTYTDLEVTGLRTAKLLCNLKGAGKVALWKIKQDIKAKENYLITDEKYFQDACYNLYLSSHILYIVKMDTKKEIRGNRI